LSGRIIEPARGVERVRFQSRRPMFILAPVLFLAWGAAAREQLVDQPAEFMPLVARSLLLDADRHGEKVVVVGERGHILLSDDGGDSFRQVPAPSRSTLTAVVLLDETTGFAAGHDGVVLRSRDGGRSWSVVHAAPEEERPLLDLWFKTPTRGLAVGAYGWLLRTTDGGATWEADTVDPEEPHINAVDAFDDRVLITTAEFGFVFRSTDAGGSFERLELPYGGSFFGVLTARPSVLIFGLQGHVFRSTDRGTTWAAIDSGTTAAMHAGVELEDGRIVLGGLQGVLLVSDDRGLRFKLVQDPERLGISALLELADGRLLLLGEGGVRRIDPSLDPATIETIGRASG
jgi:photosystem II stability/assembly factor-like uncharacterized protein